MEAVDKLQNPLERGNFVGRIIAEASTEIRSKKSEVRGGNTVRSDVANRRAPIPSPSSFGARVIDHMPLELVFECMDKDELFRLSWGAKNTHGAEWDKLKAEFEERLAKMKRDALREKWLAPKAVYGYWQAQSDGNVLLVYENGKEITRFEFPRQDSQDHLCLADYFCASGFGRDGCGGISSCHRRRARDRIV